MKLIVLCFLLNSKNLSKFRNIRAIKEPKFLTSNIKKTFNFLILVLIQTLIIEHFNL